MSKKICAIPFIEAFTNDRGGFRNCCDTYPQLHSQPGESLVQWWTGAEMENFRKKFDTGLPPECHRCELQESVQGFSFRTAVNKTVDLENLSVTWPSRWNIIFGNVCNLSCWTCSEYASSVIEQHKRTIGILPENFRNPQEQFEENWPKLKSDILTSYEYHSEVTLTLLGGEPFYNKLTIDFIKELVDTGLSKKTKLEFHTNATRFTKTIGSMLQDNEWLYKCAFLSLDAVGPKAEWLRYGSRWNQIEKHVDLFREAADYIEVQCILSILNIGDLPALKEFCVQKNIPLKLMTLAEPHYMSLSAWPGNPADLVDRLLLEKYGFGQYYDLIGTQADPDAIQTLRSYIKKFDTIRTPLNEVDSRLSNIIGL